MQWPWFAILQNCFLTALSFANHTAFHSILSPEIRLLCISKKDHTLQAFDKKGNAVYSFAPVVTGRVPGPKTQRDDGRTPEGKYKIRLRVLNHPRYYKLLLLSYPNRRDRKKAKWQNLDPGDDICIHGFADGEKGVEQKQKYQKDGGTAGCVVLPNKEMDFLCDHVSSRTNVRITG